jgi:hypothetical protein
MNSALSAEDVETLEGHVQVEFTASPALCAARRAVRHWAAWIIAPLALLVACWGLRLDRRFVAVALLILATVVIRLVQAWSDYDLMKHADQTKKSRDAKRLGITS